MTARRFCFTIFDVDRFYMEFDPAKADLRFICFQTEITPTTGERHVQGYIELNGPQRMTGVKRILGDNSAHVEQARGSADSNIDYCTKEDSREEDTQPTIYGDRPEQGKRSDLINFVDAVKAGYSDRQILDDHPKEFVRFNRCMLAVRTAMATPRTKKPHVSVFWGPTATGKSARAHLRLPNAFVKQPGNKWWDGYTTGQSVIMDDFVDTQMEIAYLLQLLDRYAFRVEVKGASVEFNAPSIIITSNINPDDWYLFANDAHKKALSRRFDEVIKYDQPYIFEETIPFHMDVENDGYESEHF